MLHLMTSKPGRLALLLDRSDSLKVLLLWFLSLPGIFLGAGCAAQKPAAKVDAACETSGESDCGMPQSIKGDAFSIKMEEYFVRQMVKLTATCRSQQRGVRSQ